jgi:hypothetical protein
MAKSESSQSTFREPPPFFVLVDAENVSHRLFGPQVNFSATRTGLPCIRRAFGEKRHAEPWRRFGFLPCTNVAGRNAADESLTAYAKERATDFPDAKFMIATSDRGFVEAVHWLRDKGHRVDGLGGTKTPPRLQAAYDSFTPLKRVPDTATGQLEVAAAVAQVNTAFAMQGITGYIAALIGKAGSSGITYDDLTIELARVDQKPISKGYPSLAAFLSAHGDLFTMSQDGKYLRVMLINPPPHNAPGTAPPPP